MNGNCEGFFFPRAVNNEQIHVGHTLILNVSVLETAQHRGQQDPETTPDLAMKMWGSVKAKPNMYTCNFMYKHTINTQLDTQTNTERIKSILWPLLKHPHTTCVKGSALALLYGWSDQNMLVKYTHSRGLARSCSWIFNLLGSSFKDLCLPGFL